MLDGGQETILPAVPAVPVERLRALVRMLYPEEMTPTAKRVIEGVAAEYELAQ